MNTDKNPTPTGLLTNPKRYSSVADLVREVSEDKALGEDTAKKIEERNILNFLIGLRTSQDMSQCDIAKKMGCTQSKISKLESGIDRNLSMGDFNAYTKALGFEMMVLLGKKHQTLVQRIKTDVNVLRKLIMRLAELCKDSDALIKNGAIRALASAAKHLAETMQGAADIVQETAACVPDLPMMEERNVIEIQSVDDDEREPVNCAAVRDHAKEEAAC